MIERVITAFLIVATLAALHERVVETLWSFGNRVNPRPGRLQRGVATVKRGVTQRGTLIPGVLLAFAGNANLLSAVRYRCPTSMGETCLASDQEPVFFSEYLYQSGAWPWFEWGTGIHWAVGCFAMGAAVSLGSSFWHDLAFGLSDLRKQARDVTTTAREQITTALAEVRRDGGPR